LYELLTGRSAFEGSGRAIQVGKAAGDRAEAIAPGSTPDDALAALAMELLDPDPALRPGARAVLRRLAVAAASMAPTFGLSASTVFVGREAEVEALGAAAARVRA